MEDSRTKVILRFAKDLTNVEPWWQVTPGTAQDPYIVFSIGAQRQQSRPARGGGQHPQWNNEEFTFTSVDAQSDLKVEVLHQDRDRRGKVIGTSKLPLREVWGRGLVEKTLQIVTVMSVPRGELRIAVECGAIDEPQAAASTSQPRPSEPAHIPRPPSHPEASEDPGSSGGSFHIERLRPDDFVSRTTWVLGETDDVREHYELGEQLGRGTFGVTYLATCRTSGERYACKTVSKHKLATDLEVEDLRREIKILKRLSGHPNIVAFKAVYEDARTVYLVMELCTGPQLLDSIWQRSSYTELEAATTLHTILSVVAHCHKLGIMHRDLRPENFMLASPDPGAPLKAIDFGCSLLVRPGEVLHELVGTPYYMAPEVLHRSYGLEADIYSCGVILYTLLSGQPPSSSLSTPRVHEDTLSGDFDMENEPWPWVSESAKDCVRRMMAYDPKRRLTAKQVLEHKWMVEVAQSGSRELHHKVLSRLKMFAAGNTLKQMARMMLAKHLPLEKIRGLKALFRSLDKDGSGTITLDELFTLLKRPDVAVPPSDLQALMSSVDVNGDGRLDYQEFLAATMDQSELLSEDNLLAAFEAYDQDKNNQISKTELKQLLWEQSNGMDLGVDVDALLTQIDLDGDGQVNRKEFMLWMRSVVALVKNSK